MPNHVFFLCGRNEEMGGKHGKLLFQEFHPFNEAFFLIMISSLLYQPDIFNFVQQTKTNVKMKCNLEGKKLLIEGVSKPVCMNCIFNEFFNNIQLINKKHLYIDLYDLNKCVCTHKHPQHSKRADKRD